MFDTSLPRHSFWNYLAFYFQFYLTLSSERFYFLKLTSNYSCSLSLVLYLLCLDLRKIAKKNIIILPLSKVLVKKPYVLNENNNFRIYLNLKSKTYSNNSIRKENWVVGWVVPKCLIWRNIFCGWLHFPNICGINFFWYKNEKILLN